MGRFLSYVIDFFRGAAQCLRETDRFLGRIGMPRRWRNAAWGVLMAIIFLTIFAPVRDALIAGFLELIYNLFVLAIIVGALIFLVRILWDALAGSSGGGRRRR